MLARISRGIFMNAPCSSALLIRFSAMAIALVILSYDLKSLTLMFLIPACPLKSRPLLRGTELNMFLASWIPFFESTLKRSLTGH